MTVLWEEDDHHAGLTGNIAVGSKVGNLRNILLGIIFGLWQQVALGIAEGFLARQRNLDVNHLVVGLNDGLLGGTTFGDLDVDKEVFAYDFVLTGLKGVEVVLSKELYYLREQRIHRGVILEVFNLVDNHNNLIFK